MVRTLPCHGRGREFESRRPRHIFDRRIDCKRRWLDLPGLPGRSRVRVSSSPPETPFHVPRFSLEILRLAALTKLRHGCGARRDRRPKTEVDQMSPSASLPLHPVRGSCQAQGIIPPLESHRERQQLPFRLAANLLGAYCWVPTGNAVSCAVPANDQRLPFRFTREPACFHTAPYILRCRCRAAPLRPHRYWAGS